MPKKYPSLKIPDFAPTNEERNRMRAYLQRAEVRFSTMQRIAGILLNGAGLMILLSTLFSSKIVEGVTTFLSEVVGSSLTISYLLLLIPIVICLLLPFHFLYVLLKELTGFYFLKPDEAATYNRPASSFVLPASVLPSDEVKSTNLDSVGNTSSGSSLVTEVDLTQSLLARHTSGLSKLILRYVKALLVLIWTTFVLFMTVAFFQLMLPEKAIFQASFIFQARFIAALYAIWGGVTFFLVKHPFRWIELDASSHPDVQLKRFITEVEGYAVVAIVSEVFFILSQINI